eukprot:Skav226165  [mRNA]  locus=scaffold2279:87554:93841:+ [translate_table: standard]
MPPRARAKAKGKAKAKAAARPKAKAKAAAAAKARARGRAPRRLRRPAGEREGGGSPPEAATEANFEGGDWVKADQIPLVSLREGREIIVECSYWGATCKVCGHVQKLIVGDDRVWEVTMTLSGTDHEELLKWATGQTTRQVKVHLCGTTCPNKLDAANLVHAVKGRLCQEADRGGWADNLKIAEDELATLRQAEADHRAREADDKKKGSEKDPKKKKKGKRDSSSSGGKEKKEKKSKKKRVKPEGQKSLEACLGKTGLDPTPKVRKQVRAYVKRHLKKRKKKEDSSSSESDGSSKDKGEDETEEASLESDDLFGDHHRIRAVGKRGAGVLACETIREMQRQLLTNTGAVWEQEAGVIPPLALQFYRQQLAPKLSAGPSREALTLSFCLDALLQGKIATTADVIGQRLKSLELAANGASWSVAQKVELIPGERSSLSSRSEAMSAARESREESKTWQMTKGKSKGQKGDQGGSSSWKGSGKENKGKDAKGKGKNREKEEAKKPYKQPQAAPHFSQDKRSAPPIQQCGSMGLCPYGPKPGRRPLEGPLQTQMASRVKQHVEGRDRASRQRIRQELGPLRQLTVQPKTRARYSRALDKFFGYLQERDLQLPRRKALLDPLISDYVEFLWSSGEGRSLASDSIAALQDRDPSIKGCLSGSWRLLKTWNAHEIPNRAPPLTEEALQTLAGHALFNDRHAFALSLLLGFYGLLRTGELLALRNCDISQAGPSSVAIISLGLTKGGQRMGAAESVTITEVDTLRRLWQWKQEHPKGEKLCPSPSAWRKLFNLTVQALSLTEYEYRPYSLRRGGATFFFKRHGQLDRLLIQGRWQSSRTARLYLNDGLALLAEQQLKLAPHARVFHRQFLRSQQLPLPKLEHAHPKGSRAGATGRKQKSPKKSSKKKNR